ncbi:MAG: hypothetical protein ACTSPB_10345, partial [Candidatus Thorarchaeota archaeon]
MKVKAIYVGEKVYAETIQLQTPEEKKFPQRRDFIFSRVKDIEFVERGEEGDVVIFDNINYIST